MRVWDIREMLKRKLSQNDFVVDKSGVKLLEIVGASFLADKEIIFGNLDTDYVQRELEWYRSESLKVADIPGKTPKIWEDVSCNDGFINSNYGWCIFNKDNYQQYKNVRETLMKNRDSRRTSMIYTRPSMHEDYCKNGMSDFMCTYGVDYFIRGDKLHSIVHMRSNDVVFGYKNDRAWQMYVLEMLANDLGVEVGNLHWQVSSLHVYERHFDLVV